MERDCTGYSSNIVFLNLHPKPMENIIFLNLQMRYIISHTTWDIHFRATPLSLQAHVCSLHTACTFFDDVNSESMFHFEQKETEVTEQGYFLGKAKHIQGGPAVFPSYLHPPSPGTLNQNHLLYSRRPMRYPGSFSIHHVLRPLQLLPKSESSHACLGMQFSGIVLCLACVKLWVWYLASRVKKKRERINHQNQNKRPYINHGGMCL